MVTLFLTPLHLSSVKLKIYVQIFSNLLIFILKVVSFGFSKHYNQFLPYLFHCLVCLPEPTLSRLVRNLRSRDLTSLLSVFFFKHWNKWINISSLVFPPIRANRQKKTISMYKRFSAHSSEPSTDETAEMNVNVKARPQSYSNTWSVFLFPWFSNESSRCGIGNDKLCCHVSDTPRDTGHR